MSDAPFLSRRQILHAGTGLLALPLFPERAFTSPQKNLVVYKSPYCGCCSGWVQFMTRAGFTADVRDLENIEPIKRQTRVPEDLAACHTSIIGSYVVEGHVPVEAVEKLIAEQPEILGIAVPGMPMGSPGMGYDPTARYDVVAFSLDDPEGRSLFMRVGAG